MAGGAQQWSVVGKSKSKNDSKLNSPKEKGKRVEKLKAELAGPFERSPSMFDAFLEKDRKESMKLKKEPKETQKVKEVVAQSKKKKPEKKAAPTKSVSSEEIFLSITEQSLKDSLGTAKVRFPDSPLIWLKELYSVINNALDVPVKDFVFSSYPEGYPSSMLKKNAYAVLAKEIKNSPPATLQIFFEVCLQTLSQETIKGLHTLGYCLVLQCLAKEVPSVVRGSLSKCAEYLNTYKNRQEVCLSILWVCGQAGLKNLETGFEVWNVLMFPVINTKACSNYAVSYLEKLLRPESCMKVEKPIVGVKELFPILDCIFSNDLPVTLQKRLLSLYPMLKHISHSSETKTVLRNFFPSYLRRLEQHCPVLMKSELLASLKQCLLEDSHCFSVWRQLYVKHLVQSRLLISELNKTWDVLPPKFPKKPLQETLRAFQVTNEQLITQGKSVEVDSFIPVIDELFTKMNSQRFKWSWFFLIFFLCLSSALAYDVNKHGSFEDSATGGFLKDSGLLDISKQAIGKITLYSGKGINWLKKNIPVVTKQFGEVCGPHFVTFWKKISSLAVLFWNSTASIRVYCNNRILSILLMLNDTVPGYLSYALEIAQYSANIILDQIFSLVQMVRLHGPDMIKKVPVEEIQTFLYSTADVTQKYIFVAYEWVHSNVSFLIAKYM